MTIVRVGLLLLVLGLSSGVFGQSSSFSAKSLQVNDNAVSIQNGLLYLQNSIDSTGSSSSVGVNTIATTINAAVTHQSLSTLKAIKDYSDQTQAAFRATTKTLYYPKVSMAELVGMIVFAGGPPTRKGVVSTKWIECDGRALTVAAYPNLFAVLGYRYGGSGTTFNLPNMGKRVLRGYAASSHTSGTATGGTETKSISVSEMPSHTHSITDGGHGHNVTGRAYDGVDHTSNAKDNRDFDGDSGQESYSDTTSQTTGISINNAGGNAAYNQMQPYRVIRAYIRALP